MEPSRVYSNGLSLLHSKRVMDVNVLPGPMSKIKIQKTPALNVHLYIRNEPLHMSDSITVPKPLRSLQF